MTETAGKTLAAELRRYFHIGPRTRRYRTDRDYGRRDMHREMLEAINNAVVYPGYFSEAMTSALRPGWGAVLSYGKHVDGYRIDGTLRYRITSLNSWQFAALLGNMVDAGVTCTGDGERFFAAMAREVQAP